jgi:hypothetical protein
VVGEYEERRHAEILLPNDKLQRSYYGSSKPRDADQEARNSAERVGAT